MSEENQNQHPNQTPEQADPKYKETLLLYNEQNGAVEAVSDLKQSGNQYKVTTTQPLTANKPAFYDLRNSSAVAAFIKGFMSQENAKPFHFLKVAADKASEVTQSLLRLADNPKDPEGLKALYDHRVTSYQLEKVKFDTPDLKLQELKEMGIIVTPKELDAMKHGLPCTELHDVTLKVGNMPIVGQFALQPYRDMNGDVQVGLTSALPRPEFEREEYRMMFSTSEKEQLLAGKTPDRLYELPNPHTGEKEWCFATLNPATNRLVTIPKRDVPDLRYFNGVRLDDTQQNELALGGRVFVEGCAMRGSDITYSGKVGLPVQPALYLSAARQTARRASAHGPAEPRRSGLLEGEGSSHSGQERQGPELYPAYRPPLERRGLRLLAAAPSGAAGKAAAGTQGVQSCGAKSGGGSRPRSGPRSQTLIRSCDGNPR